MSTTVRVSEALQDVLRELAMQQGLSMEQVLERAVDQYKRECMIRAYNDSIARMSPEDRASLDAENREWDGVLMDGLEDDEDWD